MGVTPWVSDMIKMRVLTAGAEEDRAWEGRGAWAVEGCRLVAGLGFIVGEVEAGRDSDEDAENGRHRQDRLGLFLFARRGERLVESDAGWAPCRDVKDIDAEASRMAA